MMKQYLRPFTMALATVFAGGLFAFGTGAHAAQAAGIRAECGSNHSLAFVRRRLDGTIDQLSHDQHDYGGRRVDAIADLQRARGEILGGEQYAISSGHEDPRCFAATGPAGGSDGNWGVRAQRGSNSNIAVARRSVNRMIGQLQRDQRDYGGHRVAAISDLEAARIQLLAADRYASSHGH